jgi:hypothetical protein
MPGFLYSGMPAVSKPRNFDFRTKENIMLKRIFPALILIIIAGVALAAVPNTIHYQGYLKNSDGTPVTTQINVVFSMYSSNPARNNPVWRESRVITPLNGTYSIQLGSVTPITSLFDVPYYLGLKIENDAEMALQPLSSVPYAKRSAVSDSVSVIDSSLLPTATALASGIVKPDNSSIVVGSNGIISASSTGKTILETTRQVVTISGVDSSNVPIQIQTILLKNQFDDYANYSIRIGSGFVPGSLIRFVNVSNTPQMIVLPQGNTLLRATDATDWSCSGLCNNTATVGGDTPYITAALGNSMAVLELIKIDDTTWVAK